MITHIFSTNEDIEVGNNLFLFSNLCDSDKKRISHVRLLEASIQPVNLSNAGPD